MSSPCPGKYSGSQDFAPHNSVENNYTLIKHVSTVTIAAGVDLEVEVEDRGGPAQAGTNIAISIHSPATLTVGGVTQTIYLDNQTQTGGREAPTRGT